MIRVEIPGLRLVSEANAHEHYRNRQKRAAEQHQLVALFLAPFEPPAGPCVVHITRIAPCALDSDNLTGSAKHVRDAIAKWLGVDDRDPSVTWHVGQERGKPKTYGVRIVVRAWNDATVGARVRVEGETTLVDLAMTPAQRAGVAKALLMDGPVNLEMAGMKLNLTTARMTG